MKHISNEQKVKEICGCVDCGNPLCYEFGGDGYCFEYNKLMKLAKWKDARCKELWRIARKRWNEWADEREQQLIGNFLVVLSAHMHGGEIDEVLAELDEKMKGE